MGSKTTRAGTLVALLLAGGMLAGCSTSDEPEETPTPQTQDDSTATTEDATKTTAPPPNDATETTTAPPTLTPEEQDEADATAALKEFNSVLDAIGRADADIEALDPVSVPPVRDEYISQFMYEREQGWSLEGSTSFEVAALEHIGDDQIQVQACYDLSESTLVDEDGESVDVPNMDSYPLIQFVLDRSESAEHGWVVSDEQNSGESCAD